MTNLAQFLPPEMGLVVAAVLIFASFLGSFITVAFGIGGGGFFLAVLAVLISPLALIPVHGVVQFGSNLGRTLMMAPYIAWRYTPWFLVGTVAGVMTGGVIVVNLPGPVVQIGVGGFVLWSVVGTVPRWLPRWPVITGFIASMLTMYFGATGLFVASFTKSLPVSRHSYVATHGALMTVQHLLKTLAFGLLGFAFAPWVWLIIAMIMAGFVGTWTGKLVLNRLPEARFRLALNAVLVLISLQLIWSGLRGLLGQGA